MFLSRKFANTRSTKALRDYFALPKSPESPESPPTAATLASFVNKVRNKPTRGDMRNCPDSQGTLGWFLKMLLNRPLLKENHEALVQ